MFYYFKKEEKNELDNLKRKEKDELFLQFKKLGLELYEQICELASSIEGFWVEVLMNSGFFEINEKDKILLSNLDQITVEFIDLKVSIYFI
jgi:hypothetical protein